MNPDKLVWSHVKRTGTAERPLQTGEKLCDKSKEQFAALQNFPFHGRSFFKAPSAAHSGDRRVPERLPKKLALHLAINWLYGKSLLQITILLTRRRTWQKCFGGKQILNGGEMTDQDNQVTVQMLEEFAAAWNRHDIDALMSFMADDCEFHAVAGPDVLGRSFKGRDAVCDAFQLAWQTLPDAAWLDGIHFVCGDRGVSESTFRGTKADGSLVEARMVDIFTFRNGKIAIKNAYRKDRPPLVTR